MVLQDFKAGVEKAKQEWANKRSLTKTININDIRGQDTMDYGILLDKILEHINIDSSISALTLTNIVKEDKKKPAQVEIDITGPDSQRLVQMLKDELGKDGFKPVGGVRYTMNFLLKSDSAVNTTSKKDVVQNQLKDKLTQMLGPVLQRSFGVDFNNIAEENTQNDKLNLLIEEINKIKKLF